ncbi:MAG: hypothetical protein Q8Q33_05335, partial [Chlamydiota bacterium]|nr:hypothetical protein [Chlamydiota bacterium]
GDFDEKKSVVINWLLCCCALALVAHDEDFAYEIFEDLMIRCGRGPTLDELLAAFEWGLWFGIAAPPGEWKQLIPKVSLPLMLFLAKIEERTLSPGLTLKFTSLFFSRHRELWGKELLRLLFRRSWKKYLNGDKQNRMQTLGMRFLKMLQD